MSSPTLAAGMSATPSSHISLASIAEFRGKPYRAILRPGAIKPPRSVRSRFLRTPRSPRHRRPTTHRPRRDPIGRRRPDRVHTRVQDPYGLASLMDLKDLSGLIKAFFDVYQELTVVGTVLPTGWFGKPMTITTPSFRSTLIPKEKRFPSTWATDGAFPSHRPAPN